ncbi:MAG TPA: ABC transporter ATP-binding protein [Gaiella sp.]|nr:ABC transporter ATP-binding protein [Gaiella sp.]
MADASVVALRLEKRYGLRPVLRDVTFELARGGALLVTGPNGAGKSTLLRLIAGLAAPSRGSLDVRVERRRIGFLGHEPLVYRELTALENLDLYGRLYRVPERRERLGMLLERFGLWEARHQRISSYSRGMTQRLALCRALLHEPDLVVLDEPHASLDDEGLALLDAELGTLSAAGATLVVATHDPARVAAIATDRIALERA